MFSLCIPTMNRFDSFLRKSIEKYLTMDLVDEIIITDETGDDVRKIKETFGDCPKIRTYVNYQRLGPFMNKYKCCKLAKNHWIALIDSDNFADENYFNEAKKYIHDKRLDTAKNVIIAPSFAKPNFDYRHLGGQICRNKQMNKVRDHDANTRNADQQSLDVFMNTGNYVMCKDLISDIDLSKEISCLHLSSACDVLYFNTLLFEQLDLHIHIDANLQYDHSVHDESIYLQTHNKTSEFIHATNARFASVT